jgi:AbrB family looped-hinge helix DNA binding protein
VFIYRKKWKGGTKPTMIGVAGVARVGDFSCPLWYTAGKSIDISTLLEYINRESRDFRNIRTYEGGYRDMNNVLVENAKVMAKGQITLPKDIREILGVGMGDRVTFICRDNQVIMMNAAIYAMNMLQGGMKGEFEKAGINSDEDVMNLVKEVRSEIEGL